MERNQGIQEYLNKRLRRTLESLQKGTKRLKQPQTHKPPIRKQDGSCARNEEEETFAVHLSKSNPWEITLGEK